MSEGELESTFAPQTIRFKQSIETSHLRFVALSGFGVDQTAALAEFAVLYQGSEAEGEGVIEYRRARSASEDIDEGLGE